MGTAGCGQRMNEGGGSVDTRPQAGPRSIFCRTKPREGQRRVATPEPQPREGSSVREAESTGSWGQAPGQRSRGWGSHKFTELSPCPSLPGMAGGSAFEKLPLASACSQLAVWNPWITSAVPLAPTPTWQEGKATTVHWHPDHVCRPLTTCLCRRTRLFAGRAI